MTTNLDPGDDDFYTFRQELHTRYVTPKQLQHELQRLLGKEWKVEMRHNVYNIRSCTNFDIKDLLSNCQAGRNSPRTFSPKNVTERTLNNTPGRLPEADKVRLQVTVQTTEVYDAEEGGATRKEVHPGETSLPLNGGT